jgi:hypothetical protein
LQVRAGRLHFKEAREDMNVAIRRRVVVTISGLFMLAVARAADPSFSITINTPRPVVELGSEVRVSIVLKNISSHPVDFWRSPRPDLGEEFNRVEVRDEEGNAVPETKYYRIIRGKDKNEMLRPDGKFSPMIGNVSVAGKTAEPGEVFRDEMVLNKLVEIGLPGKYVITVRRLDETTKSFVSSNAITLTVTK